MHECQRNRLLFIVICQLHNSSSYSVWTIESNTFLLYATIIEKEEEGEEEEEDEQQQQQ